MYKIEPLTKEHNYKKIAGWFNDPILNKYTSHRTKNMSDEDVQYYIYTLEIVENKKAWAIYEIFTFCGTSEYKHYGNISLQNINNINRSAEIAWMISEQGKGAGTEAGRQVLDYAFNILNLNRVWCGCVKENIGMVKLAGKLGMKQEGISREAFFLDGRYTDIIQFGILKGEWNEHKS